MINKILKWLGCKCPEKDLKIVELTEKNNQLNELNKILGQKIIEPISLGQLKYGEAYSILGQMTGNIYMSDEYYQLTSIENAKKFSDMTKVKYNQWTKNDHDCDNFSFALMGYWSEGLKSFAFGIAWSPTHAFNFMVDNDKKLWIVEPQTNQYISFEQAKKNPMYFPIRMAIM